MRFPISTPIPTLREDVELQLLTRDDVPRLHAHLFKQDSARAAATRQMLNESSENLWTKFEDVAIFEQELNNPKAAYYGICYGETLVGGASLIELNDDEARIGYWVGAKYAGHGYATCVARALADAAINAGYRKVWAAVRLGTQGVKAQIILLHAGFNFDVKASVEAKEQYLTYFVREA